MKYVQKPSVGFWLLAAVSVCVIVFFVWGFSTPRLDKIWELEEGLKTGSVETLSDAQKNLFYDVFEAYPNYAKQLSGRKGIDLLSANSDGLSLSKELLILRSKGASQCSHFSFVVSGASSEFPLDFSVKGRSWDKKFTVTQSGLEVVELPKDAAMPELIEVTRTNKEQKAGSVDVKVRFCD